MFRWRQSGRRAKSGGPTALEILCRSALFTLTSAFAGCGSSVVDFEPNFVYGLALRQELGQQEMSDEMLEAAMSDVGVWVDSIFGTPDSPKWDVVLRVSEPSSAPLVDVVRLQRAAGAISSDEAGQHYGLYREHCVSCHGVTGDGRGPAAMMQRPYPRDFRTGVFKFKSTERGRKPLREDLVRTLRRGIPGSSMPSFALIDSEELDAIVDYLVYLAVRGEVERRLVQLTYTEFDYGSGNSGDRWLPPPVESLETTTSAESSAKGNPWSTEDPELARQVKLVEDVVRKVVESWSVAPQHRVAVPGVPSPVRELEQLSEAELAEATSIFQGQIANCASCHGVFGDGRTKLPADYDDWTKEWTTRLGIDPKDRERLSPFLAAGAFMPKPLPPRHLGLGAFRGGGTPEDLYRRIVAGIDGTSMPAVNLLESPGPTGLTEDQVWLLVRYVNHLGERTLWEESEQPASEPRGQADDPIAFHPSSNRLDSVVVGNQEVGR